MGRKLALYTPAGWVDIPAILQYFPVSLFPFIFIIGGRGTGKTYGILKFLIQQLIKFVYLRRTQTEIDECINPDMNPFKKLNSDYDWAYAPERITKNLSGFYERDETGKAEGDPVAYAMSLATVANIRGFDASDCDTIFFDEFIAEIHKQQMRGEAEALFNAYETVNRNRELEGRPPTRLICAANSNNIINPVFMALGLIDVLYDLAMQGKEIYVDKKRGLVVINMLFSPASEKKKETALYKLTQGSRFYTMAIKNQFEKQYFSKIASRNVKEYRALVKCGEFTIYEHKSRPELYVTRYHSGTCPVYRDTELDRRRAKYDYAYIWSAYCNECITFESVMLEALLVEYFSFI